MPDWLQSVLQPAGPQAERVHALWRFMLAVSVVVYVLVVGALLVATFRRRPARADLAEGAPGERGVTRIVSLATAVTALTLFAFLVFDFSTGRALTSTVKPSVAIEVTGHQWWWEVEYEDPDPSKRLTTANEIHVPVGEPVQLKLRSVDVNHSFWAPNLNGKKDLIPGYLSTLGFTADTAGVYRGQCAEFCGLQHAKMAFDVIAEPKATFQAWLAAGAKSPPPPTDSTQLYGQRVFLASGCAVCHTIGGTPAQSFVGPPLTHLKSRRTIAAGTLANTKANLMGWITNPQAIKPGTRMPAVPLKGPQLAALVDYLETLK